MLKIVEKNEMAKRKEYRYSAEVIEKKIKARKERKVKKDRMAKNLVKINALTEAITDDLLLNNRPTFRSIY